MNKFPVYNCPDILLYDFSDEYKRLYQSKVYELEGVFLIMITGLTRYIRTCSNTTDFREIRN